MGTNRVQEVNLQTLFNILNCYENKKTILQNVGDMAFGILKKIQYAKGYTQCLVEVISLIVVLDLLWKIYTSEITHRQIYHLHVGNGDNIMFGRIKVRIMQLFPKIMKQKTN